MDKKVTLKRGINLLYSCMWLLICAACGEKKQNTTITIANKGNTYVKNNFTNYSINYKIVADSITVYMNSKLEDYTTEYLYDWQIDSLICFNSEKDLLVAVILNSSGKSNGDAAEGILGKKINNNWYFFKGVGTLIIPRNLYGKDSVHPLSFYELSQIARKEMLEGALIKNEKGEWVVNDKWIGERFYNNGFDTFNHHKVYGLVSPGEEYQMPRDKEKTDSVHWSLIMDKWKHKIDTNIYKTLRRNARQQTHI